MIRDSQITELLEKVALHKYGKYLLKIQISKLRSFEEQSLTFDFPVTALVGPNGGGKTTVLGAAACAYKEIKPAQFFAKNGRLDESMQHWKFEYEAIDKKIRPNDTIRRTAKFTNYKWSRDGLNREVVVFGVSRTVPATEIPKFKKYISSHFSVRPDYISQLETNVAKSVASILDKDVSNFSFIKMTPRGDVTLLAGQTQAGDSYSEFHFGAGESSVIRMVVKLEDVPENSFVLIEEIENGLHPLATIRMVEYLIELAERKKVQVLFTTHSNDALIPLPDKAIWAAVNGNLFQGKLDIKSLRVISGEVEPRLAIFVEDNFAKLWLEAILRTVINISLDCINVYGMEGDGTAVNVHNYHNLNPAIKQPSICFIDGDSRQQEDSERKIFRLPGMSPELYIFEKILEIIDNVIGELTVVLLRPYEEQHKIKEILLSTKHTNRDPHIIFGQIGKSLGFISEIRVMEAFATIWSRSYASEVDAILEPILPLLPKETDTITIPTARS